MQFWYPLCTCKDALNIEVTIYPDVSPRYATEGDFQVRCVECKTILKYFNTERFTTSEGLNALRTIL